MRFLIIGMQRSGTTLVGQVMNSHPGVSMFADELKVDPIFTQGIAIYGIGSIPSQDINAGYIKLFDAITHKHGASLWGAKVALQEPIQASKLVYIINNHLSDLMLIFVKRQDSIARIGSLIKARKTGVYHSWSKEKKKIKSFKIRKKHFKKLFIKELEVERILSKINRTNSCKIIYEEDILNKDYHNNIIEKIGLSSEEVTDIKSKKVSPDPKDYIKNYQNLINFKTKLKQDYEEGRIKYKEGIIRRFRKVSKCAFNCFRNALRN